MTAAPRPANVYRVRLPSTGPEREERMIRIDLNDEEREILRTVLESYHSDLRMEIADTDSQDFREMLKRRKAVVRKALEALRDAPAPE